jgi:membrane fusion protein, multidrug efflux system
VSVKKGQPLARLDTSEYESQLNSAVASVAQAEADVMRAVAGAGKAERDYARIAKLKEEDIVSEQNLDDARQQRDATAADVQASRARLMVAREARRQAEVKMTRSVLKAPMDGVVANRKANVGQFVDNMGQGDPLFRIVDNSMLDVTMQVPSTEMAKVKIGQALVFTTEFLPGKLFTATVTHINPAVETATRAVSIVAEVRNTTGELRDGLFVKGRIVVSHRAGVLRIPKTAILPAAGAAKGKAAKGSELFVVDGGKAMKRAIQIGDDGGDLVEVKTGLKAGEKVVTRGAFMLQDGDAVQIIEKDVSTSEPKPAKDTGV